VLPYGAELTASTGDVVAVSNPGAAWVPVAVRNTGDQPATGWSVRLSVPTGLRPVTSDGDLTGASAGDLAGSTGDGGGAVWSCAAAEGAAPLAPGEQRSVRLRVVADGSTAPGPMSVAATPQLLGSTHALAGAAAVAVGEPWAGAAGGARSVQARCAVVGGVTTASAIVEGTYVNLTDQTLSVRLDAAGSSDTASQRVEPGESITLRVPDGLRVPAGGATWTVATTLGGETYRTTVSGGPHQAAECYDPRWDVAATAETVNADGRLRVRGTLTNTSDEPMRVGMTAAGGSADDTRLAPGESATFTVPTDRTTLDAGSAVFQLHRWVADSDGDDPAQGGVVPSVAPTARYESAVLAPAVGGTATLTATECRFDASADTSWRTVTIPVDNTASTHAVRFAVQDGTGDGRQAAVRAGGTGVLEVSVPWGTRTVTLTADGRELAVVDVPGFEGCATATWPGTTVDVSVATRCVDDRAQVVVNVRNRGSVTWTARLAGADGGTDVEPGSGAALVSTVGGVRADAGSVALRLDREIERRPVTVERTFDHDAVSCVVVAPQAHLEQGDVHVEKDGRRSSSTRQATLVLDNSGSSVPQEFTVRGSNGAAATVTVPARQTARADGGTVVGREGATYAVSAGDWSTDLAVEPFTGTSGWCADRLRWGGDHEVGDVASWRGVNYRYVGRQAWTDDQDQAEGQTAGEKHTAEGDAGSRGKGWSGHHTKRAWERVGDCEYR
jgi:trimeric autotransporter adhesin